MARRHFFRQHRSQICFVFHQNNHANLACGGWQAFVVLQVLDVIYFDSTSVPFVLSVVRWRRLSGMTSFSNRTRPDPTGPDWIRLDPTGPDRTRPDPTGPDWTRLDPTGPDWTRPDPTRPGQAGTGRTGPGQAGPSLVGLGPVVYSSADDLPVVFQWFSSGFLQWFIRVPTVFGERALVFFKRQKFSRN